MGTTLSDFLNSMMIEIDQVHLEVEGNQCLIDMFDGEFVGQCTPLFRWVGGKSQLLSAIRFYSPNKFNTYFEPFVGGGALLFALMPGSAYLNDANPVIIQLYKDVRDNYIEFLSILKSMSKLPDTEMVFLTVRNIFNEYLKMKNYCVELSALFIYLNAKCFNGLYRVNSNGEFNVGYAKESALNPISSIEKFKYAHDYFKYNAVKLMCGDFTECTKFAKSGDFVYFDPPYVPLSNTKSFTNYSKTGFNESDQYRLFKEFERLTSIGVKCLLSNSECDFIYDTYRKYTIKSLNVNYYVQPTSDDIKRSECLVMNF